MMLRADLERKPVLEIFRTNVAECIESTQRIMQITKDEPVIYDQVMKFIWVRTRFEVRCTDADSPVPFRAMWSSTTLRLVIGWQSLGSGSEGVQVRPLMRGCRELSTSIYCVLWLLRVVSYRDIERA